MKRLFSILLCLAFVSCGGGRMKKLLSKFYIGMLPKKATIYKYFGKYEYNNCIHYTMGRFFISINK